MQLNSSRPASPKRRYYDDDDDSYYWPPSFFSCLFVCFCSIFYLRCVCARARETFYMHVIPVSVEQRHEGVKWILKIHNKKKKKHSKRYVLLQYIHCGKFYFLLVFPPHSSRHVLHCSQIGSLNYSKIPVSIVTALPLICKKIPPLTGHFLFLILEGGKKQTNKQAKFHHHRLWKEFFFSSQHMDWKCSWFVNFSPEISDV